MVVAPLSGGTKSLPLVWKRHIAVGDKEEHVRAVDIRDSELQSMNSLGVRSTGLVICGLRGARRALCVWADMAPGGKANKKEKPVLRHVKYIQRKGPVAPSTIDMQVVGTGAGGSPRAVTCDFTHSRYLFNCSEGTQRVCVEHKMRLAKLENIFITHTSWKNVGGLLGMALTLDGVNVPKVTVHGPPDAAKLVQLSRQFAPIRTLHFEQRDMTEGQFKDAGMTVDGVPIYPEFKSYPNSSVAAGADRTGEPAVKKAKLSLSEEMAAYNEESAKGEMSMVYVCSPIQKPRPVSLEKCVKLGISVGPLIGKLKGGATVTLEDGRKVTPEEILDDVDPELPFIVVEAPTEAYLNPLLASEELSKLQSKEERRVQVVVHFTPQSVMEHPQYQEWLSRFHRDVDHLIVNDSASPVCFEGLYALQAKLNLIHPHIFSLLPHMREPKYLPQPPTEDTLGTEKMIFGETALKYLIRVGQGHKAEDGRISRENCFKLDIQGYQSDVHPDSQFEEHLKELLEKIKTVEKDGADKPKYPELLFLGTGSSIPNKDRNVSAILLKSREDEGMLLDVGEDTYGQLYRNFAKDTPQVLMQINSVFISHLHADHHMGLYGVLEKRLEAFQSCGKTPTPVYLLVTENVQDWLQSLKHTLDADVMSQVKLMPLERFAHYSDNYDVKIAADCRTYLKMQLIEGVRVSHRKFPFGIVMTHQDGWKLSYSGDTMPCRTFASVGEGSDILIHEATMEDDMLEDARHKKHSTMSQAIAVGQEMKAKFIMLTHFSQRYSKIPLFTDKFVDNVGIAFDNMQVNPQQLHLLPLFKTTLRAMFYEHYQEMEARALKHNRRRLIEKGFTKADTVENLAQKQLAHGHLGAQQDLFFSADSSAQRDPDVEDIFKPSSSVDNYQDTSSLVSELTGQTSESTSSKLIEDLSNNKEASNNASSSSEDKSEKDSESERQSSIS